MKSSIIKVVFLLLILSPPLNAKPDQTFKDIVNYSASIDGFSSMCVKNYNDDEEQMKLFNLLSEIKNTYMLITNDDYEKLKSIYIKTKSATITQLLKLKLNVRKNNCMNYVKIFDRFDKKKSEKLKELEKLIENY
tara:strand:+ start:145 stop:549 length:405 start_codon:yes stop_codon:yes gene_type:complete